MLSLLLAFLCGAISASAEPWKFGVMGDSQWTTADPGNANPYTVPLSIINQVNQEFIKARVKFVIAVGDLSDDGNDISEINRAKRYDIELCCYENIEKFQSTLKEWIEKG